MDQERFERTLNTTTQEARSRMTGSAFSYAKQERKPDQVTTATTTRRSVMEKPACARRGRMESLNGICANAGGLPGSSKRGESVCGKKMHKISSSLCE